MNTTKYLELSSIGPIFADRLAAITQVGAVTHLCFTAARPTESGCLEHVLEARIIVPTTELKAIIAALIAGQHGSAALVPFDVADAMVQ